MGATPIAFHQQLWRVVLANACRQIIIHWHDWTWRTLRDLMWAPKVCRLHCRCRCQWIAATPSISDCGVACSRDLGSKLPQRALRADPTLSLSCTNSKTHHFHQTSAPSDNTVVISKTRLGSPLMKASWRSEWYSDNHALNFARTRVGTPLALVPRDMVREPCNWTN